jgi:hypothetical protein
MFRERLQARYVIRESDVGQVAADSAFPFAAMARCP